VSGVGLGHVASAGDYGEHAGRAGRQEGTALPTKDDGIFLRPGIGPRAHSPRDSRHRSEVRYCYELALTENPDAAGKVSVEFRHRASGQRGSAARP